MIEITNQRFNLVLILPSIFILLALISFIYSSSFFVSISVLLYVFTLILTILLFRSRYSLLNPVFMFCLLSLTLYSLNWVPFLFISDLYNDTYNFIGYDSSKVESAILKLNLLNCFWLVCAIIGHLVLRINVSWRSSDIGFNYKNIAIVIILVSIFSFYILVDKAGSFFDLMIQRELTREDRLAASIGRHWFAFAQMGVLGIALWAFSEAKLFKSWYFLPIFITVLLIGFIVSGNRTSIVMSCVLVYGAWAFKSKKLFSPTIAVMLIALFVILGLATVVREEGFSNLQESGYESGAQEIGFFEKLFLIRSERAIQGSASLGVLMALDDGAPYINGESLKSIPYIPIPSSFLTEGKPPAAGRLAAQKLAGRNDTAWPVSPVVEAYWNFGFLGVFFSGIIYGLLSSFIYRLMINNFDSTIFLVGYFSYITTFSVGSDGFYKFIPVFIPLAFLYFIIVFFNSIKNRMIKVNLYDDSP